MGYELYVISDPTLAGGLSHEEIARLAIEGGADAIQLRDKKCDKQDLVATGRRMRKVTRDANVLFVVNDCLDVALSCGADGVHLGQCDLQVNEARARAPRKFIIGASVSCAADAILAIQQGQITSRQVLFFLPHQNPMQEPPVASPESGKSRGQSMSQSWLLAASGCIMSRRFWRQELTELLLYRRLSRNRTSHAPLVR